MVDTWISQGALCDSGYQIQKYNFYYSCSVECGAFLFLGMNKSLSHLITYDKLKCMEQS